MQEGQGRFSMLPRPQCLLLLHCLQKIVNLNVLCTAGRPRKLQRHAILCWVQRRNLKKQLVICWSTRGMYGVNGSFCCHPQVFCQQEKHVAPLPGAEVLVAKHSVGRPLWCEFTRSFKTLFLCDEGNCCPFSWIETTSQRSDSCSFLLW